MNLNNIIVKNCMIPIDLAPVVKGNQILKEAFDQMDKYKLGIVIVIDSNNDLVGVITDGDIRRKLIKSQKPLAALLVDDIGDNLKKNPVTIGEDKLLIESIKIMNKEKIWDLPVLNNNGKLVGLLHLHSAIKKYLL